MVEFVKLVLQKIGREISTPVEFAVCWSVFPYSVGRSVNRSSKSACRKLVSVCRSAVPLFGRSEGDRNPNVGHPLENRSLSRDVHPVCRSIGRSFDRSRFRSVCRSATREISVGLVGQTSGRSVCPSFGRHLGVTVDRASTNKRCKQL